MKGGWALVWVWKRGGDVLGEREGGRGSSWFGANGRRGVLTPLLLVGEEGEKDEADEKAREDEVCGGEFVAG